MNRGESVYLVDVGLLDLCLLGAGARGIEKVTVSFHHTRGF